MLVVIDNIHFRNKSFAFVCHFPYLFNFSYNCEKKQIMMKMLSYSSKPTRVSII